MNAVAQQQFAYFEYDGILTKGRILEPPFDGRVSFLLEGSSSSEDRPYLDVKPHPDGLHIFVMRYKGIQPRDKVKLNLTPEKVDEILQTEPLQRKFLEHWSIIPPRLGGRNNTDRFTRMQGLVLEAGESGTKLTYAKDGSQTTLKYWYVTQQELGIGADWPEEFLSPITPEETKKYELRSHILNSCKTFDGKILRGLNKASEELAYYQAKLTATYSNLYALNSESKRKYILDQIAGMNRSLINIKADERVGSVKEDGNRLVVTTKYLTALVQNVTKYGDIENAKNWNYFTLEDGSQLNVPIGRVKITFAPDRSPEIHLMDYNAPHPHKLPGGYLCYGQYGDLYSKALASKNYYTCFQIAIEVLTNLNTNDTPSNALLFATKVLKEEGVDNKYWEDRELKRFNREKLQAELNKVVDKHKDKLPTVKRKKKEEVKVDTTLAEEILTELKII